MCIIQRLILILPFFRTFPENEHTSAHSTRHQARPAASILPRASAQAARAPSLEMLCAPIAVHAEEFEHLRRCGAAAGAEEAHRRTRTLTATYYLSLLGSPASLGTARRLRPRLGTLAGISLEYHHLSSRRRPAAPVAQEHMSKVSREAACVRVARARLGPGGRVEFDKGGRGWVCEWCIARQRRTVPQLHFFESKSSFSNFDPSAPPCVLIAADHRTHGGRSTARRPPPPPSRRVRTRSAGSSA